MKLQVSMIKKNYKKDLLNLLVVLLLLKLVLLQKLNLKKES